MLRFFTWWGGQAQHLHPLQRQKGQSPQEGTFGAFALLEAPRWKPEVCQQCWSPPPQTQLLPHYGSQRLHQSRHSEEKEWIQAHKFVAPRQWAGAHRRKLFQSLAQPSSKPSTWLKGWLKWDWIMATLSRHLREWGLSSLQNSTMSMAVEQPRKWVSGWKKLPVWVWPVL